MYFAWLNISTFAGNDINKIFVVGVFMFLSCFSLR